MQQQNRHIIHSSISEAEPKSISTGGTSNTLELMCSEHITSNTDLRWHLLQSGVSGRATVKGITLSQTMIDIVRMSPLNWGECTTSLIYM